MATKTKSKRPLGVIDVGLWRSLSTDDLELLFEECNSLQQSLKRKKTPSGIILWLLGAVCKELKRRESGDAAEPFFLEIPPREYAEDPLRLAHSLLAVSVLVSDLADSKASSKLLDLVEALAADVTCLACARLKHYSELLKKLETKEQLI